ncbi:hypothetical protein BLNAU_19834 [Blattamonas nauphoetae]|uniref:B30.2/SPRY domain-containing protein n=1 Tax=Blattamonas nauphoetae TaxID=2049346 RepID=A0ABQ9X0Z8_9EUKA|nr:hypothetical protein BLNAU_19834 [Blattamonas nauphoetae]
MTLEKKPERGIIDEIFDLFSEETPLEVQLNKIIRIKALILSDSLLVSKCIRLNIVENLANLGMNTQDQTLKNAAYDLIRLLSELLPDTKTRFPSHSFAESLIRQFINNPNEATEQVLASVEMQIHSGSVSADTFLSSPLFIKQCADFMTRTAPAVDTHHRLNLLRLFQTLVLMASPKVLQQSKDLLVFLDIVTLDSNKAIHRIARSIRFMLDDEQRIPSSTGAPSKYKTQKQAAIQKEIEKMKPKETRASKAAKKEEESKKNTPTNAANPLPVTNPKHAYSRNHLTQSFPIPLPLLPKVLMPQTPSSDSPSPASHFNQKASSSSQSLLSPNSPSSSPTHPSLPTEATPPEASPSPDTSKDESQSTTNSFFTLFQPNAWKRKGSQIVHINSGYNTICTAPVSSGVWLITLSVVKNAGDMFVGIVPTNRGHHAANVWLKECLFGCGVWLSDGSLWVNGKCANPNERIGQLKNKGTVVIDLDMDNNRLSFALNSHYQPKVFTGLPESVRFAVSTFGLDDTFVLNTFHRKDKPDAQPTAGNGKELGDGDILNKPLTQPQHDAAQDPTQTEPDTPADGTSQGLAEAVRPGQAQPLAHRNSEQAQSGALLPSDLLAPVTRKHRPKRRLSATTPKKDRLKSGVYFLPRQHQMNSDSESATVDPDGENDEDRTERSEEKEEEDLPEEKQDEEKKPE